MNASTISLESHFPTAPDFFTVYQQMQAYCFCMSESWETSQTLLQSLLNQKTWEQNLVKDIASSNNLGVEVPAVLPLNHSDGLKLPLPDSLQQVTTGEITPHTGKKSLKVKFPFNYKMVGT